MKIRILKCDSLGAWYAGLVGQIIEVERLEKNLRPEQGIPCDVFWCRTGDVYNTLNYVRIDDAEVLDFAAQGSACDHRNRRDVGATYEGMGSILVYWCPDCGALKRTMTNWKCTDYPWELPRCSKS